MEQWFHQHDSAILVTTCAWGMGVDKKNVRTVIHLNAPPTAEAYVQEAGRGGRDGSPAQAVLLWSPEDKAKIVLLPEKQRKRAEILVNFAESGRCRREVLLEALGEFTVPQLIRILHENLPFWRAGDISSLISQLIHEQKIRPANAFFWKGALT